MLTYALLDFDISMKIWKARTTHSTSACCFCCANACCVFFFLLIVKICKGEIYPPVTGHGCFPVGWHLCELFLEQSPLFVVVIDLETMNHHDLIFFPPMENITSVNKLTAILFYMSVICYSGWRSAGIA